MHKLVIPAVMILLLSIQANPQQAFRDLVIDETTVEQVIERYGSPKKDELASLDVPEFGKRLVDQRKEKVFRQLTYADKEFFHVRLSFLDGKLVMIDLGHRKRIPVTELPKLFEAQFEEAGRFGVVSAHYPETYSVAGVSNKAFIIANCSSERMGTLPGIVTRTRQVSRRLEKR